LRGEWGVISGVFNGRALLRAAGETSCTLCYVVALARMPIADVVAILQTEPLFVIFGAAFLLRERIGPARSALALVGFGGALLVAQPGVSGMSQAAMIAFGAAVLVADYLFDLDRRRPVAADGLCRAAGGQAGGAGAPRVSKTFLPMTLGNMRANGGRALIAKCEAYGHKADVNVDALPRL
jgi:drug/metabolite transporter (DMT)-like permease